MKTISRDELTQTIKIIHHEGYACPRCKLEKWATRDNQKIEEGWCCNCAYAMGEPLKIIDQERGE